MCWKTKVNIFTLNGYKVKTKGKNTLFKIICILILKLQFCTEILIFFPEICQYELFILPFVLLDILSS